METATQFKILPQEQYNDIFSPELVTFLNELHSRFNNERIALLHSRKMKTVRNMNWVKI